MLGACWLGATTNSEGDHDAELLPLLALIPLLIAVYHFTWSRFLPHTTTVGPSVGNDDRPASI